MKSGIASSQTKIDAHYTQAGDICVPPSAELSPQKKCPQLRAFFKAILHYFLLAYIIQSLERRDKFDFSETDWKALIASAFLPKFKLATPKRT